MSIFSWRGAFVFLFVIGVVSIIGAVAMEETIDIRFEGSIIKFIGRLGVVARNKNFTNLLLTFSILNIAFMAYISIFLYLC